MRTRAPSSSSAFAVSKPMPSLAPTTSAVSPSIPRSIMSDCSCERRRAGGKEVTERNLTVSLCSFTGAQARSTERDSRSVDLSARHLDDFFVFVVIGLKPSRELLRRHDERIERLAFQLLAHVGHLEDFLDVSVQLVDHRFRRRSRCEHADPRGELITRNARFGERGYLRKSFDAVVRRHRERPNAVLFDLTHYRTDRAHLRLRLAGRNGDRRRPAAFVRH